MGLPSLGAWAGGVEVLAKAAGGPAVARPEAGEGRGIRAGDSGWRVASDAGSAHTVFVVGGSPHSLEEVDAFIASQRERCLWFMRRGFQPRSDEERLIALDTIVRHGDRAAFVRASELKRWLSQRSKSESVVS